MNKSKSDEVLFYSEKLMRDGKMHYSVGIYNRVNGTLSYPSDVLDLTER